MVQVVRPSQVFETLMVSASGQVHPGVLAEP
jgi:hypothetical protein